MEGLFNVDFNVLECKLNVVSKIGFVDLIKYVWLFVIFVLKVLNLCIYRV